MFWHRQNRHPTHASATPPYALWSAMLAVFIGMASMGSRSASGQDMKYIPTLHFSADGGTSTYKSELVESNDTATSIRYGMGLYAGADKLLGFGLRMDSQTTPFALNESQIVSSWQETFLTYRWGYMHAGAIISLVNMSATQGETDLFDLTGNGYGATFGAFYPFSKDGSVRTEINFVQINTIKETNQVDVSIGQRLDVDVGANFHLVKKRWLDLLVGYRMRTLSITLTETFAEQITSTYLGLSTVFIF